jgi:hypothetical protein
MTASLGDGDDESHLLVLAGGVTGFVTGELVRTERLLVEATSARSALRERERLARTVHDGVLQLLALVQRQARDGTADWDVLGERRGACGVIDCRDPAAGVDQKRCERCCGRR